MASPVLNRCELPDPAGAIGCPEGAESVDRAPSALSGRDAPTWRPECSERRSARHQVLPAAVAAGGVVLEEFLVADLRGGWTPSQMVERKFMALLRSTTDVAMGTFTARSLS